jgi:hypothetical protein
MFAQIPHRQTTEMEHIRKQKYSAGHMRCCRGGRDRQPGIRFRRSELAGFCAKGNPKCPEPGRPVAGDLRDGRHHGGGPAHRNAGRPGHTASLWAMKRNPAETHGLLSIFHTASPARCRKSKAEVPHGTRPCASIAKPRQRSRRANREPFQARHRRVDCDHRIDRGHPGRDFRSRVSAPGAARNAGFFAAAQTVRTGRRRAMMENAPGPAIHYTRVVGLQRQYSGPSGKGQRSPIDNSAWVSRYVSMAQRLNLPRNIARTRPTGMRCP